RVVRQMVGGEHSRRGQRSGQAGGPQDLGGNQHGGRLLPPSSFGFEGPPFPAAAPGRTWRRAARGLCRESPVFRRQALLMPVLRPVWSPWKWGGLFTMSRVRRETRRRRRRTAVALGLVVAVVGLTGMARPKDGFDRRSRSLEAALRAAVQAQHFERVVDFGPVEGACPGAAWCPSPAATIAHMPNIDLAVIALDRRGRPRAVADVLFSRDYPHGAGVPVGDDLGT